MADQSDDIAPIKRRNLKRWGLVLALVLAVAMAAFYSVQSRNPNQSGTEDLHAHLDDLSLTGSRFSASVANDGIMEWDVDSVQISQGSINCIRLPKGVEPGSSATMRCSASGIKTGASYILFVSVKDVGSEDVYMVSSYVVAMP